MHFTLVKVEKKLLRSLCKSEMTDMFVVIVAIAAGRCGSGIGEVLAVYKPNILLL